MNSTLRAVPELVWCVHPISGTYTQFQRLLFWVVIIVILFFQFHQWLIAGSIALAATYSFTASIHSVALGIHKSSASDGDLLALQVILQSSIIASLLCVIFCPRLFRQNIRQFWIWWCLLVFLARLIQQSQALWTIETLPDYTVPVHCDRQGVCKNPCEGMKNGTIFREPSDPLQPVIWSTHLTPMDLNVSISAEWIAESPTKSDAEYEWLCFIWLFYNLLGPVLQCVIINANLAPREARNLIFHRLRTGYVPRDRSQPRTKLILIEILIYARYFWIFLKFCSVEIHLVQQIIRLLVRIVQNAIGKRIKLSFHEIAVLELRESSFRYRYAKGLAVAWYLWAELSYLVFIGGAIYIVSKAEKSIQWVPESETKIAVGQWSTWTAFGLAVTAAAISRLTSKRSDVRKNIYLDDRRLDNAEADEIARMARALKEEEWNLYTYLAAQLVFRWLESNYWWLHTVEVSAETRKEMDLKKDRKRAKRKNLQDDDDSGIWATVDLCERESAFLHDGQAASKEKRISLVPPSSRAMETYNFLEDEQLQTFLQRKAEDKAKTRRRSWLDLMK